jgi:hypothetical protein
MTRSECSAEAYHGHAGSGHVLRVRRPDLQSACRDGRARLRGHGPGYIGRNESGQPAQDISVIIAPVGGAFRSELDATGPYCNF